VPRHRLVERPTGDKQEADAVVTAGDDDLVARVEQHQGAVADLVGRVPDRAAGILGGHRTGCGRIAERAGAVEHVGEGVAAAGDRDPAAHTRRHRDVEVGGLAGDAVDGPGRTPEAAADNPCDGAIVLADHRYRRGLDLLIARGGHLVLPREIEPQLEAVHPAGGVAAGHLLVDDPRSGGHPLHVAGGDRSLVAEAVAVVDLAGEDVGHRLDAAVGMPWEARPVVVGPVAPKVVEEQVGVEGCPAPMVRQRDPEWEDQGGQYSSTDLTIFFGVRHTQANA
jgi:hypothetical protein